MLGTSPSMTSESLASLPPLTRFLRPVDVVRRLLAHPADEFRDLRMRAHRLGIGKRRRQFAFVEHPVDHAVADHVDEIRRAPAFALRHPVMPVDARPRDHCPSTERAGPETLRGAHLSSFSDIRVHEGAYANRTIVHAQPQLASSCTTTLAQTKDILPKGEKLMET